MPPPAQPASAWQPSPSADVLERVLTALVKSGRVLPRQGCRLSGCGEMCYVWPQAARFCAGNQLSPNPARSCGSRVTAGKV